MTFSRAACLAAAAALAAGCGRATLEARGRAAAVVEAEGWAPIEPSDPLGTRRRSLADAEKKAVEQVAGVYVAARTRVEQDAVIEQRVLSRVEGYIDSYQVLGRRRQDGFLKTRIRAVVSLGKLDDELRGSGLRPAGPPGAPRVAVLLSPGSLAAPALRAAFAGQGFVVVEDTAAADLLVEGRAEVHDVANDYVPELRSARARVEVEAIDQDSGRVLGRAGRDASAADVSAELAEAKALAAAGELAGKGLASALSAELKTRDQILVRISGLSGFERVRAVADALRLEPDIQDVVLERYADGRADFRVATRRLTAERLGALLASEKGLRLSPQDVKPFALTLQAR